MEKRNMSGALFVNDKDGVESRPDYSGDVTVNGQTFKLKGWKKTAKTGKPYLSLSVEEMGGRAGKPAPKKAEPLDDEIPF